MVSTLHPSSREPSISASTIRCASQGSPKGIMDFLDGRVEINYLHTSRLQERSRTTSSSSGITLEATRQLSDTPPTLRLTPRYDESNRSFWSLNPNARQTSRVQEASPQPPLAARKTDDMNSELMSSHQLPAIRGAGEVPSTLPVIPFDF